MAKTEPVDQIRKALSQLDLADLQAHQVGVNRCRRAQRLTRISITAPTVMMPVAGEKRIKVSGTPYSAQEAELLILPHGAEVDIDNLPDRHAQRFESAILVFDPETLALFNTLYVDRAAEWPQRLQWKAQASDQMLTTLSDWIAYAATYQPDATQTRHRMAELLLLLAQQGIAGNLLLAPQATLSTRIKTLLAQDLGRDWRATDLTATLGMSESTLRRRLRAEGRSYRDLLEEVRLDHGIDLVMATDMPISQIAFQCGYISQSRFAERFRKRYSLSPTDLRATRHAHSAEVISLTKPRASQQT